MKLDCKLENMSYDFAQKRTKFELSCWGNTLAHLEEYQGKELNVEIKKAGKRSNNANRIHVDVVRRTSREVKDT